MCASSLGDDNKLVSLTLTLRVCAVCRCQWMHMSSCDTLFVIYGGPPTYEMNLFQKVFRKPKFFVFILKKTWIVLHVYHFDPYLYRPLSILQRRGEFHFIFIISTPPPPSFFQFHVNFEEVKWVWPCVCHRRLARNDCLCHDKDFSLLNFT